MNEPMIVALAVCRGRNLDHPDLAEHITAQNIWQAWTPVEELLELPPAVEELIDEASAQLGHFTPAGPQRKHAWECAHAAAWGHARPRPHPRLPANLRQLPRARRGAVHTLARLWRKRPRPTHQPTRRASQQ
jgi:hypothetical protein